MCDQAEQGREGIKKQWSVIDDEYSGKYFTAM